MERADFTLCLLMFVTAETKGEMFIIYVCFQFLFAVESAVLSKDRLSDPRP